MSTYKGKVRKIGNTWFYDVYVDGVRERKAVGPNKKDAEDELAKIKGKALSGEYRAGKRKKVRFESFAEEYLEHSKTNKRSWKRDEVSLNALRPFFKGMYLTKITKRKIEEYRRKRLESVANPTVNREIALLKNLFNLAISWKLVFENPVRGIKMLDEPDKERYILSPSEAQRLIENASDHLKPFIIIALNTGMRPIEVLSLRWRDVDFEARSLYVSKKNAKSKTDRHVPINSKVADALRGLDQSGEFVFPNEATGRPLQSVKRSFNTAKTNAGIPNLTQYDLRHTAITWMIRCGVDITTVSEIAGHSSIEMTLRYVHTQREDKQNAVDALCRLQDQTKEKMVKIWSNGEAERLASSSISTRYTN